MDDDWRSCPERCRLQRDCAEENLRLAVIRTSSHRLGHGLLLLILSVRSQFLKMFDSEVGTLVFLFMLCAEVDWYSRNETQIPGLLKT